MTTEWVVGMPCAQLVNGEDAYCTTHGVDHVDGPITYERLNYLRVSGQIDTHRGHDLVATVRCPLKNRVGFIPMGDLLGIEDGRVVS